MVTVLKDRVLEFYPDTLEYVRKDVNLEKEERIEEAVDILDNWVKKQQHFLKKDFPREDLERTLISAKGLVERAKQRIDKLCTLKTLTSEMYPSTVSKKDYEGLYNFMYHAHLPKLTKEHYRVYILNMTSDDYGKPDIDIYYRYLILIIEYLKWRDYNSGFILTLDLREANILNFVTKFTPMELRQLITLMTEGYGMRIKQIHLITGSKMIDAVVALLKQVLSAKLAERIHLHKNLDTFYAFVPKYVLPEEYGGAERSLKELNDEWLNAITTPDFVEYFQEICKAKTNESYRQAGQFNEQYVGMPGSFRALSVD